jgi:hypothetical protein
MTTPIGDSPAAAAGSSRTPNCASPRANPGQDDLIVQIVDGAVPNIRNSPESSDLRFELSKVGSVGRFGTSSMERNF